MNAREETDVMSNTAKHILKTQNDDFIIKKTKLPPWTSQQLNPSDGRQYG